MRTLRLLLAVGISLAPALAATAAGTTPAFAGGGAGMTLTATMDGQDQRLLVGTRHTVHITLADTPGEADLRDITISLTDLDPSPLPVVCPAGRNGHLSLEPDQSLQCTSVVTAAVGFRTLVARATASVPSEGTLVRTAPLHYNGFMPPPPPRPVPVAHAPLAPDPASGRPTHAPVAAPTPPLSPAGPADPADPADPARPGGPGGPAGPAGPARPAGPGGPAVGDPVKVPVAHGCLSGTGSDGNCCGAGKGGSGACCSDKAAGPDGCCGSAKADACCGSHPAGCCSDHSAADKSRCCGSAGKSGDCVKRGGLAFTGMSTPLLAGAASGGLALAAGGFMLLKRFARR
ncbi:hypothetical protein Caci_6796 [Catenulispora acidiphila DSM 44928]|uniref:Uncharacterized protein n=1 Tax=Catenulispora acidiphila (strain DSM 44928 / JCM 14897 / NBRC 102108 / NRRL B-24433 / ID139908) TaxID=479433 RepID=C7Q1T6_CATAD|nr:hypothetical protein [Catenulispora acidiphila]ACU75637.1 hypothetical protein Caci_6796 [Catenulispora acidiphila DSM 44928]